MIIDSKGLILNRYKQEGQRGQAAGEGVSGIVIKARDTWGEHEYVAIKRPNPMLSLVERRKKNKQIKREGEALSRLNHRVACSYVDDTEWLNSRDHCLVIAWAEGEQLEGRLRQLEGTGETLPLGEALEILSQLADLLVHAHNQGVVHNDLDAKHLFWGTESVPPQLTVIDWANCAFSTDANPVATIKDDLKQYGELMHRFLTGTTVAYATRLGGEDNWQVEMTENDIPDALQQIVARAIGRDEEASYTDALILYDDLQRFRQKQEAPFREKVTDIDDLLEKNTASSLNQAETLLDEVSVWNPTLVSRQRTLWQQLKCRRAENLARIGGKTSLLAEQWETAQEEIAAVFGIDIYSMPQAEERYIYLFGDLMARLDPKSRGYTLGKEAIQALFKLRTRDENKALDKILLLYGQDIPDHDPLISELSQQTKRVYPIRSRIRQSLT